jgi:hypothetical protein
MFLAKSSVSSTTRDTDPLGKLKVSNDSSSSLRPCVTFRNVLVFLTWVVVSPPPNPKLEDHPLLAVRDYLFNIFAATLHTRRPSTSTT